MKRPALVIVLSLVSFALPIRGAAASGSPAARSVAHRYTAGAVLRAARLSLPAARLARLSADRRPAQDGAVTSGTQLRLPATAFPAGSQLDQEHLEVASDADNSAFSTFHVSSYTALGMQGGWLQYYTTKMSDGLFDVAYLGTYYPSAAAAGAAFADVRTNPALSHGNLCTVGDQCFEDSISLQFGDGLYSGQYRIVRQGNAVAEMVSVVPDADFYSLVFTILGNVDRVSSAFLATVQTASPPVAATPTPTTQPATAAPTQTPTSTPAPTSTATNTATATATATDTAIPLFVRLTLGHRSVKPGARQSIAVTTLPGASVRIALTFPDGGKKAHTGTAGGDGTYTWSFTQPASHTAGAGHTVKVAVSVSDGTSAPLNATARYSIG